MELWIAEPDRPKRTVCHVGFVSGDGVLRRACDHEPFRDWNTGGCRTFHACRACQDHAYGEQVV